MIPLGQILSVQPVFLCTNASICCKIVGHHHHWQRQQHHPSVKTHLVTKCDARSKTLQISVGSVGKSDSVKVLEKVIYSMISPSKFLYIVNLISVIVMTDSGVDEAKIITKLKYKIFKQAPTKFGLKKSIGSTTVSNNNLAESTPTSALASDQASSKS